MAEERTITTGAIDASRSTDGTYAVRALMEMEFASEIAGSSIAIEKIGSGVAVQTTIDRGKNWHYVEDGDTIPGLEAGKKITDGELQVRVVFDPGQGIGNVTSIIATIDYTSSDATPNQQVITWSSEAAYNQGTYFGTWWRHNQLTPMPRSRGRVTRNNFDPENATTRQQDREAYAQLRYYPSAPYEGAQVSDPPTGLDLSRGNRRVEKITGAGVEQQYRAENETAAQARDRFERAAWGFESWIWLRSDAGDQTRQLFNWLTSQGAAQGLGDTWSSTEQPVRPSVSVYFREAETPTSTHLVVRNDQYSFGPAGGIIAARTILTSVEIKRAFDRWMHVAFVYDGLIGSIYVDGRMAASRHFFDHYDKKVGQVFLMDRGLIIGNWVGTDRALGAYLADLRFFNKKPSLGGINARRRRRPTTAHIDTLHAQDGLAASYIFEEVGGSVFVDQTAAGNDLVLNGQAGIFSDYTFWDGVKIPLEIAPSNAVTEEYDARARGPYWLSNTTPLQNSANILRLATTPFNVTWDGKLFTAVGSLGAISDVEEDTGVTPTAISLTLSGVNSTILSVAWGTEVLNQPARVYLAFFDMSATNEADRLVQDPIVLFEGLMDELAGTQGARDPESGAVPMEVSLTVQSELRNWERPRAIRWSDKSHRGRHPNDFGFGLLAITSALQIWWPSQFAEPADLPTEDEEVEG